MQNSKLPAELAGDERYRLLVESITDYAIYLLDASGTVVSWNAGARRFKGYEAHEIIGSHFSRFYTVDDRRDGKPEAALATARRDGRFESEGWRVRKDGTHVWTHVIIDPILRPSGELIGYAKITRDLTERRTADLALRESEQRFRILVNGVTDYAIYMLDSTGIVTNWNAGAERIKQYTSEEIVGQHFSKFYTGEDRQAGEPDRALQTARREGRFEREGWRVRRDGSRFWANVVIDPIRDEAGTIIGFAKVTRDITERREAQQALAAAQEAFFQSQKMEAIGQLTGGVAHDFNNLLAAVLGGLELLRKRCQGDDKMLRLIEQSEQGARRGVSLTQRMLAFARRQELKPEPVDVTRLVQGISELLRRTIGPDIALELDFPANLKAAQVDANQLELAIVNLTVNARDAMPGGGTIRISGRECEPDAQGREARTNTFICIAVADTGHGMDAETLARATEPFFTTKGVGKGTGLGLSMVQGLAAQLGGRLRLLSQVGEGTTAELFLPVASSSPKATSTPEREMPKAPEASVSLRILAVDDDLLVLMNTVAMLEDLGHTVTEAVSGESALKILESEEVDLLITDQAMPHIKGSELIARARSHLAGLPVILATGYAELEDDPGERVERLAKPFSQQELARAIKAAVTHRH
jgi:PAS domain S-box-containing protein